MELTRTLVPHRPLDLRRTLQVTGLKGPNQRVHSGGFWRASRTPEGPATVRLAINASRQLEATAWGSGGDWMLDRVPAMVGERDDLSAFTPRDATMRDMLQRGRGVRLPAAGTMVDVLIPVILAQKVTGVAAGRSYRKLVRAYGEPAPGPIDLMVVPDPVRLAAVPYYDLHPFGIEKRRADTLLRVCAHAPQLESVVDAERGAAYRSLEAIRGVGPWTSARVMMVATGDADAVPVGDYHIPNSVAWALASEPRASDERMLELLAPYQGQRGRVVRLIEVFGGHAPKYGPKLAPRSFEDH